MTRAQISAWVPYLNESVQSFARGWATIRCPLSRWRHKSGRDTNPSFGIKVRAGESRVFCYGCGYTATQSELLVDLQRYGAEVDYAGAMQAIVEAEESQEIVLDGESQQKIDCPFPEELLDSMMPAIGHPYLRYRKGGRVPSKIVEFLGLKFDPAERRICFPVRDSGGVLMGIHGRAVEIDTEPKYRVYTHDGKSNLHVWLGEAWASFDEPIVFAESVFDLARALQCWGNVVSPLSASLGFERLRRMDGAADVVTLFDPDKAGDSAREKISRAFPYARHVRLDPDIGDAADHTADQLAEALEAFIPIDNIVRD